MEDAEKHLTVHVCRAKGCTRRGAAEVAARLETTFTRKGVRATILRHDCFDLCKQACNVLLEMPGREQRLYTQLHLRQAERFAESIAEELEGKTLTATGR
jgi:NADH:ubiquinone oxidoreductase subunit E